MRRVVIAALAALAALAAGFVGIGSAGPAFANPTPTGVTHPGLHNVQCQTQTNSPGKASSAQGSAFNPTGTAGSHYAGNAPQNQNNSQAAQYDVACFQVSH